jgi:hypothetical protein
MESQIAILRKKYRIARDAELKSSKLLGSERDGIVKEIIERLIHVGAIIFVEVAEKRFNICSFFVEDVLDPKFNDECDNSWTHPRPEKPQIAQILYDRLSDDTIALMGKALRSGGDLKIVLERVLAETRKVRSGIPIRRLFTGAKPHLDHLSSVIASVVVKNENLGVDTGVVQSPNFFAYTDLINNVENFYARRASRVKLVFDSSPQYNRSYAKYLERLMNAPHTVLSFPGKQPLIFGYKAIQGLDTVDSKLFTLMQCADLVASGIAKTIAAATKGIRPKTATEKFLLSFPIAHQFRFGSELSSWVVSEQLVSALARASRTRKRRPGCRGKIGGAKRRGDR